MTYNEVLPLDVVKNYLRIDSDFTEDDNDIERMVRSSLQWIEMYTNHIVSKRDKTYHAAMCKGIDVWDYPINSETPDDRCRQLYALKSNYSGMSITLNVGYETLEEIPSALLDAALQIIKVWYFEAEKQSNTQLIPQAVKDVLFTYKRFIAC